MTGSALNFDWKWFQIFNWHVQYVKYHEPIYRTIEKFVDQTGNNDIDIAAFQVTTRAPKIGQKYQMFQIFFPSLGVTVHRQRYDYSASQFVSEIGGAAGLVVGASVISIVQILDDMIASLCFRYQKYLCRVRHVNFPHPLFLTNLKPRLVRVLTTTLSTQFSVLH